MPLTVFYSWQSDTPSRVNRNFIEDALNKALRKVNADAEVVNAARGEEVILEKDTKGLPGTPPIVETIFNRIDQCSVFVPDLTFVAQTSDGRPTPNANVLIEYGWALKSRRHHRIVPLMNDAFGEPSETSLPFNMRHLRWPIRYTLSDGSDRARRSEVRTQLVSVLANAIRGVLDNASIDPIASPKFEEMKHTYDKGVFFGRAETLAVSSGFREPDKNLFVPEEGAKMFLRLVPTVPTEEISPSQAHSLARGGKLEPFALRSVTGGEVYDRNRYGSVAYRPYRDTPIVEELTQLFKNRELWGITCELRRSGDPRFGILPNTYEAAFTRALENYLRFARERLQLKLPLRLIAGFTGIEGFKIAAPQGYHFGALEKVGGRAVEPDIVHETAVDSWEAPHDQILVPFFKDIWDAFGVGDRPDISI